MQQIVLLDGPSVLGWDRWREIAAEHGLGLIEATLQAAIDAGAIAEQPVRPLAHVLMGALDEAAMLVARAEDPEAARAEVGRTLDTLLAALSARAGPLTSRRLGRAGSLERSVTTGSVVGRAAATPSARTCARRRAAAPRGLVGLAGDRRPRPRRSSRRTPVPVRGQRLVAASRLTVVEALLRGR